MTTDDLAEIEYRARLFTEQGDVTALRPEDVQRMIEEIREARQTVARLIAINRDAAIHRGRGEW